MLVWDEEQDRAGAAREEKASDEQERWVGIRGEGVKRECGGCSWRERYGGGGRGLGR